MDRPRFFVSDLPALFSVFTIILLVAASYGSDFWTLIWEESLWHITNFVAIWLTH